MGAVINKESERKADAWVKVEPIDVLLEYEIPTNCRVAFFKGPDGESIELMRNIDRNGVML